MTVWIVNPFDNLPLEGNRPQRYWLMARAFAAAGHQVTLWTSDFSHATKRQRQLKSAGAVPEFAADGGNRLRADGFAVVLLPTRPYPTNVCWQRLASHLALARSFAVQAQRAVAAGERPEVVIASTPTTELCSAAWRIARSCGAKFVCDIQDAWPETFGRLFPNGLKWLGWLLLTPMRRTIRTVYRKADLVTGVCRRYAQLSGRPDFYLAYHGIEANAGRQGQRPRPAATPPRLVYVGNLGAGYDLSTVVRALAQRPDWTLAVAGLGPQQAPLQAEVAALGVAERVHFHGYLSAVELEALMTAGSVGVIPMRDDSWVGLPYKLGDYLKAGLPVVSSLRGECGELLARTGFGRTYEWGGVESFLQAVESLPPGAVTLPVELCAETIYAQYVRRIGALLCPP
ncbi:MAG: glycosyltransferase family 4 protein [Kiritimatiellia bacterium]